MTIKNTRQLSIHFISFHKEMPTVHNTFVNKIYNQKFLSLSHTIGCYIVLNKEYLAFVTVCWHLQPGSNNKLSFLNGDIYSC